MIVNYGPNPLEFDKDFIHTLGFYVRSIILKQFLDGRLVSFIFNSIIDEYNEYERFIFFDDESYVGRKYLKNLDFYYRDHVDLQVPNIIGRGDGKVHFPIIDDSALKSNDGVEINAKKLLRSLGTGLVIYFSLVAKFKAINVEVFDSKFTLREVNCGFFERLGTLDLQSSEITIQIVNTLGHSLFRNDSPTNKSHAIERILASLASTKI
ncbi:hypothetical protein [Pantoea phytobeneficialis]|nr:hypothetical protein [Pantoea phytobeneficialis]MDO6407397.1 hypothetical protein [Pantoea phytobeneficialis]